MKEVPVTLPVPMAEPFCPNEAKRAELAITPREMEILELIAQGDEQSGDCREAVCKRGHGEDAFEPGFR